MTHRSAILIISLLPPFSTPLQLAVVRPSLARQSVPSLRFRQQQLAALHTPPRITGRTRCVRCSAATAAGAGSFMIARNLFLRWIGAVYLIAFLVALRQNKALIGERGLLPVTSFLSERRSMGEGFWQRPTYQHHGPHTRACGTPPAMTIFFFVIVSYEAGQGIAALWSGPKDSRP